MQFMSDFIWYCAGVGLVVFVYSFIVEVTCSIYFSNKLKFMKKLGRMI